MKGGKDLEKLSNEELRIKLIALHSGDKIAFEEIYNDLKKPMYTIILRILQDKSLSEDILQEVFVKLFQSPPKPSVKNPRAYLFQIARNLAIDNVRKRRQFVDLESIENIVYLIPEDPCQKVDIENAIKTLPLQESQIVSLHINGALKFREIVDIMDIPLGTVLWKYQKALGRLRHILSKDII